MLIESYGCVHIQCSFNPWNLLKHIWTPWSNEFVTSYENELLLFDTEPKSQSSQEKRQIQKAKGTGYFGHDEPMTRKRMSRINRKTNFLPPSFFFYFFLFLVCGFQGILLMMTPMTRNPRQHTTAGPAPFPSFFDAHFPLVILGIHERSIDRPTDRPTDRDGCMPAGCPSFPLILQGFQTASASQKQDQVKQSCATILLQIFCLSPLSLTPPPPFNDNLSFLRASPPGLNIWPYTNICHIHV